MVAASGVGGAGFAGGAARSATRVSPLPPSLFCAGSLGSAATGGVALVAIGGVTAGTSGRIWSGGADSFSFMLAALGSMARGCAVSAGLGASFTAEIDELEGAPPASTDSLGTASVLPRFFGCAGVGADVFRRQVAPRIVGAGPRVTLYASDSDNALSTARRISAGYRRLGQAGDGIVVMPGMDTVDASKVKTDFLGHSYFGDSKTVMSDLYHLLRTGKTPANRGVLVPAESPDGPFWRFP